MLTPFQVHSGQGSRRLAERAEVRQRTLAVRLAADLQAEPRHLLLRVTAEGPGASRNASEVGAILLGIPRNPVLAPPGADRKEVADSPLVHQLTTDRQLVQFATPSGHFAGN
jgi:hypothetical protein